MTPDEPLPPPRKLQRLLPLAAFIALFCFGAALLAFTEVQKAHLREEHAELQKNLSPSERTEPKEPVWLLVLEHLGSALIVAAVMGVSYEYVVHSHVIRDFRRLLDEHRRSTDKTLESLRATTAHEVFTLIGNIARRMDKIPTLYDPPRAAYREIVFASESTLFQTVVGSTKARDEVCAILETWLDSAKLNLRFLASDFIGYLQLTKLQPRLHFLASEWEKEWDHLDPDEKGCVLNFWWAISRCEEPLYKSLIERLARAKEKLEFEWIFFVPQQMPHPRLAHMLDAFIRLRGKDLARDILELTIPALREMHRRGIEVQRIAQRNHEHYERVNLWGDVCQAVGLTASTPQTASRLKRLATRVRKKLPWRRGGA